MTTPFPRTRIAGSDRRTRLRAWRGPGLRRGLRVADPEASGSATRMRAALRPPRMSARSATTRRVWCASTKMEFVASVNIDLPFRQVREQRFAAGRVFQPLGGTGGDAGSCAVRTESVFRRAVHRQVVVRHRDQRALRAGDRVRQRLARTLPGDQVEGRNDQRQSGAVVGADQELHRRRRRQLAEDQGEPHQERQLRRGVCARRPAASSRRAFRPRPCRRSSARRRACSRSPTSAATTTLGLERRRAVAGRPRKPGSAQPTARPSSTNVTGNVEFHQPDGGELGPLPPTLAPVGCRARQRDQYDRLVQRGRQPVDQDARNGQSVDLQRDQQQMGRDGGSPVHGLEHASRN